LHGIWATPAEQAYSVGEFGTVMRWDGDEWLNVPGVPTVQSLNAIWGPDDGGFFVVGDFGTILHYNGSTWTTHVSGTTEHLFGVAGVNGSEVYAVGLGGTILRYDGVNWTAEPSGTNKMLTSVTRAGDKMMAVGDGGVVRSRPISPYAASSDLEISKTASVTAAVAGDTVSYDIMVSNLSTGAGLMAATVTDSPPVTLDCTWTCVSTLGATCRRGPWSGDLNDKIELPEAATALYTGECVIDGEATGTIVNTATVTVPSGIVDPVPGNNSFSDDIEIIPAYAIGGNVSGLSGSGLVLQNNSGDDLAIDADGEFTFATKLMDGSSYSVSVLLEPASLNQTCSVTNASGTLAGADVTNISVTCLTIKYTIGGNVSGLSGSGLTLQNNAGDDLAIDTDGGFTFSTPLFDGSSYAVTVLTQPTNLSQVCSVTNDSGTLAGANVTDVTVNCETNSFTVGGVASGLWPGTEVVLQINDVDDLGVGANGGFTFSTPLLDGTGYVVTVLTQPSDPNQVCSVSNEAGTLAGENVTSVTVLCVAATFSIGGLVTGLSGSGLVLQNNGEDDRAIEGNGSFTFTTSLDDGSVYDVTVLTQPTNPDQTCSVKNGSGTLAGADVTDITVSCVTTCNTRIVSNVTDNSEVTYEACEILVLGPSFIAGDGAYISASSGWEIHFIPEFLIEQGTTLDARVCGQSLCELSVLPMPYGCHSCVDQICDIDPACCDTEFDQSCLDKVTTVCSLVCE